MTASQTLQAVQAAVAADVPLTLSEEQALRDWTQDTSAEIQVVLARGSLKELADIIARQSNARLLREQQAAQEQRGRERMKALEAREQMWQALPDITAAMFRCAADDPHDRTFKLILKHIQRTDRGRAPKTFDPGNVLTEHERMFG